MREIKPACAEEKKWYSEIVNFSPHKVVFSDGSAIVCKIGEFDQAIIKAILEAGE